MKKKSSTKTRLSTKTAVMVAVILLGAGGLAYAGTASASKTIDLKKIYKGATTVNLCSGSKPESKLLAAIKSKYDNKTLKGVRIEKIGNGVSIKVFTQKPKEKMFWEGWVYNEKEGTFIWRQRNAAGNDPSSTTCTAGSVNLPATKTSSSKTTPAKNATTTKKDTTSTKTKTPTTSNKSTTTKAPATTDKVATPTGRKAQASNAVVGTYFCPVLPKDGITSGTDPIGQIGFCGGAQEYIKNKLQKENSTYRDMTISRIDVYAGTNGKATISVHYNPINGKYFKDVWTWRGVESKGYKGCYQVTSHTKTASASWPSGATKGKDFGCTNNFVTSSSSKAFNPKDYALAIDFDGDPVVNGNKSNIKLKTTSWKNIPNGARWSWKSLNTKYATISGAKNNNKATVQVSDCAKAIKNKTQIALDITIDGKVYEWKWDVKCKTPAQETAEAATVAKGNAKNPEVLTSARVEQVEGKPIYLKDPDIPQSHLNHTDQWYPQIQWDKKYIIQQFDERYGTSDVYEIITTNATGFYPSTKVEVYFKCKRFTTKYCVSTWKFNGDDLRFDFYGSTSGNLPSDFEAGKYEYKNIPEKIEYRENVVDKKYL